MSELLFAAGTVKAIGDGDVDERSIQGYASTGVLDRVNDRILPTAWKSVGGGRRIKILFNHDHDFILGAGEVTAREEGLHVAGKLARGIPRIDEKWSLVKQGMLDEFSVGFKSVKSEPNDHGGLDHKECDIYEVSLVSIPANPSARVTDWRSAIFEQQPEQIERLEEEMVRRVAGIINAALEGLPLAVAQVVDKRLETVSRLNDSERVRAQIKALTRSLSA